MDNITQLSEQTRQFLEYHVPSEVTLPLFIAVPVVLIAAGLGLSVLGAKLAKPAIAMAFALAGAVGGGLALSHGTGIAPGIGIIIGGLACGVAGYLLHRLWVGVAAAILMGALACGSYGAHTMLPALQSYDVAVPSMAATDVDRFTVGGAGRRGDILSPQFKEWLGDLGEWGRGFWQYATRRHAGLQGYLALVGIAAAVFGFVLGLVAPRFTAISLTSIVGIVLMTSGATALVRQFEPDVYQAAVAHPQAIGVACGAVLLGSLVLQTLLTRSDKPRPKKDKSQERV